MPFFSKIKSFLSRNETKATSPPPPAEPAPRTLGAIVEDLKLHKNDLWTDICQKHPKLQSEEYIAMYENLTTDEFEFLANLRKERKNQLRREKRVKEYEEKMRNRMAVVPYVPTEPVPTTVDDLKRSRGAYVLDIPRSIVSTNAFHYAQQLLFEAVKLLAQVKGKSASAVFGLDLGIPMVAYLEMAPPAPVSAYIEDADIAVKNKKPKRPLLRRLRNVFVKKIPRLFGRGPAKSAN